MPGKVLIVDDTALARKTLEDAFGALGFETKSVSSGEEALQTCEAWQPDLVSMDLNLGGTLEGIKYIKIIKQSYPNIKIIAVTSVSDRGVVAEAVSAGASYYVLKPVTVEKLKEVIDKVFK